MAQQSLPFTSHNRGFCDANHQTIASRASRWGGAVETLLHGTAGRELQEL
jgi:hypothetical protein